MEKKTKGSLPILTWIRAILDSYEIFNEVQKLINQSSEFQKQYEEANNQLQIKQKEVNELQEKIDLLENDYN